MITREQVVEVLRSLPADRTNEGACKYRLEVHVPGEFDRLSDEPHCIAAHALVALGLPLPIAELNNELFRTVAKDEIYSEAMDPEAIDLLDSVQSMADGNDPAFDDWVRLSSSNGNGNYYECGQAPWGEIVEFATS